jgi:hypothetical protein
MKTVILAAAAVLAFGRANASANADATGAKQEFHPLESYVSATDNGGPRAGTDGSTSSMSTWGH